MPAIRIRPPAIAIALTLASLLSPDARSEPEAGELRLSEDGKTGYVIVKPDIATPVDNYAVRILAEGLKQKARVRTWCCATAHFL